MHMYIRHLTRKQEQSEDGQDRHKTDHHETKSLCRGCFALRFAHEQVAAIVTEHAEPESGGEAREKIVR